MRDLKFRVWDNRKKRMFYFDIPKIMSSEVEDCVLVALKMQVVEPMQYSGLKDVDGKDIYEGDVCVWKDQNGLQAWPVEFMDAQFGFWIGTSENAEWLPLADICITDCKLKAVGHIYEREKDEQASEEAKDTRD